MFTVEHEYDASVITSMDESGKYQDVEVIVAEDGDVYIRQFDEEFNAYEMIIITYQQFLDIYHGLNKHEGMFKIEFREK